jgi:hypothetical protein
MALFFHFLWHEKRRSRAAIWRWDKSVLRMGGGRIDTTFPPPLITSTDLQILDNVPPNEIASDNMRDDHRLE